eukprot:gene4054-20230_t
MEGIAMDIAAFPEIIKFPLSKGFEYVLIERFCKDTVQEYFGGQRKLGRRSDNPDLYAFGYNNNALYIQRTIYTTGNARGTNGSMPAVGSG